jgi:hypothetical protein
MKLTRAVIESLQHASDMATLEVATEGLGSGVGGRWKSESIVVIGPLSYTDLAWLRDVITDYLQKVDYLRKVGV